MSDVVRCMVVTGSSSAGRGGETSGYRFQLADAATKGLGEDAQRTRTQSAKNQGSNGPKSFVIVLAARAGVDVNHLCHRCSH